MDDEKDIPSAKALSDEGYNQTYIILHQRGGTDSKDVADERDVFFRCGQWCYRGKIQFNGLSITTSDLPALIPTLQRQQGSLRYYCNAKGVPETSEFFEPVAFFNDAIDFFAEEVVSPFVENELEKMSSMFPWIKEDSSSTYFELTLGNVPAFMTDVGLIASKTYTRGLVIISIYNDRNIYFVVQNGEGDQALLDVRFPDVSYHGQGLLLGSYNDNNLAYRKLTLWHVADSPKMSPEIIIPKLRTLSVATKSYQQTYCIMKSDWDRNSPALSVHHDVLFRFGSWCYAGRVQLTPALTLSDISFVIPALRMQQSRLDYVFDTSNIPTTSPYAACLDFMYDLAPLLEAQISASEEILVTLVDRLGKMGLGESISRWLEGDPQDSFFELKLSPDARMNKALNGMELIASKTYHASGIITITIVFQDTVYVCLQDGGSENPLLDSRFPDVSGKGRGYQISAFPEGTETWPSLRKVSIWQTVAALEQEFKNRNSLMAQKKDIKRKTDSDVNDGVVEDGDVHSSECESEGKSVEAKSSGSPAPEISSASADASASPAADYDARRAARSLASPAVAEDKHSPAAVVNTTSSTSISVSEDNVLDKPVAASSSAALTSLAPISLSVARPHHLPKSDALSKRMDEIRKSMAPVGGSSEGALGKTMSPPWDAKGKPMKRSARSETGDSK